MLSHVGNFIGDGLRAIFYGDDVEKMYILIRKSVDHTSENENIFFAAFRRYRIIGLVFGFLFGVLATVLIALILL